MVTVLWQKAEYVHYIYTALNLKMIQLFDLFRRTHLF